MTMCYLSTIKAFLPTEAQKATPVSRLEISISSSNETQGFLTHLQPPVSFLSPFWILQLHKPFLPSCHFREFILNLFLQEALNYITTKDSPNFSYDAHITPLSHYLRAPIPSILPIFLVATVILLTCLWKRHAVVPL